MSSINDLIADITRNRSEYPICIPVKFSPEGVAQRFPGNTTVCHLPADSPLAPGLHALHAALKSHPIFSKKIYALPPASWHMTIFDGAREKECEPGMWPAGMEKQPLEECTREYAQKLRQFGLGLEKEGLAPPYRMRVQGFGPAVLGVGLLIEGATAEEEKRMRRLRDRLADTLGFRAPNHERYFFHLSIAYLLRHIDGEEREELNAMLTQHLPAVQREFEMGAVEFCTYENILGYPRLFYLGEKEEEQA